MGLYSPQGHVRVTVVDGTAVTGLWAPDGSMNVYNATDETGVVGLWHPCGAVNMVSTDGTSVVGRYAPNGGINAVNDSSYKGQNHPSGALNVTGFIGSGAFELLKEWGPDGLSLDFTDDFFFNSTGFYGSANIEGGGTSDGYNSSPTQAASSLLTYTSPSPKLTMGPDGLYRYQAHNLYLNSAAPANQSITVVSGATYAVTITGTVSVTASGAATGTWTAGTNTFTAATGTLTLGSTSGTGTVHVRRTPSDSTYLATAGSVRYDLPYQWDASGNLEGILVEEARTNLTNYNRDMSQSAWGKVSCTAARTATGVDGVTNSASKLTATSANGYILDAVFDSSSGSTAFSYQAFLRRPAGSSTTAVYFSGAHSGWGPSGTETVDTGTNYITNGTFTGGSSTGWTTVGSPTVSYAGDTLDFASSSSSDYVYGSIPGLTPGTVYKVTMDLNITTAAIGLNISTSGGGLRWVTTGSRTISFLFMALSTSSFLYVRPAGSGSVACVIDNITVHKVTNLSRTVTLTDDWQHVTFSQLKGGDTTSTAIDPIILIPGNGDSVEVDLCCVETGSFPTSPIETFGSSVTRVWDNIALATSAFPYNSSEITVVWKGYLLSNMLNVGGLQEYIWNFDGAPRIDRFRDTQIAYRDISIAVNTGLTISTNPFSVATRIKANDMAICKDGGAPYANASAAAPGARAYVSFLSGTNVGLMMVQHFIVLPRGMSNAELQAVTS